MLNLSLHFFPSRKNAQVENASPVPIMTTLMPQHQPGSAEGTHCHNFLKNLDYLTFLMSVSFTKMKAMLAANTGKHVDGLSL